MAHELGIALAMLSLPLGIFWGIVCGRLVYRGYLPQWVVAALVGFSCALGCTKALLELSKWLAR